MTKQLADFNKIMFINGGKGLDTVTLEVKHDLFAINNIMINGVLCDYCGVKEYKDLAVTVGDVTLCESCYDHMTE